MSDNLINQLNMMGVDPKLQRLADLMFKDNELTIEQIEARYPKRDLPQTARVTRIAPSPTGFMHIGGLYAALISERMAHQSGGVFFLRIEDTDKKREVEGATNVIISSLGRNNIHFDEGEIYPGQEIGEYGPYKQSQRESIYKAYIKDLIIKGLAYPCFCTENELSQMTEQQQSDGARPGYYGEWALWAHRSVDEMIEMIEAGHPYVVRIRSQGDTSRQINVNDLFKGGIPLPENDQDIVILKSSGLPTYHFAHAIDDHLMGTTHVVRGDEWLPSLTLHIQLFRMMGWEPPIYGHITPIQKMEGSSRRKLSKRHDPEANVEYYDQAGYPTEAVISYLFNLANPSFEAWRNEHPTASLLEYPLVLEELERGSGALLDFTKINDLSKNAIANMTAEQVYNHVITWARTNDTQLAEILERDPDYAIRIFQIERGGMNSRKDIVRWSDVRNLFSFFFDETFSTNPTDLELLSDIEPSVIDKIIDRIIAEYNPSDTKEMWLQRMRDIGVQLGYAPDAKTYKASPANFKGHFGSVAKVLRVLLTGRLQSPDLYEVMKVMGKDRSIARLTGFRRGES